MNTLCCPYQKNPTVSSLSLNQPPHSVSKNGGQPHNEKHKKDKTEIKSDTYISLFIHYISSCLNVILALSG